MSADIYYLIREVPSSVTGAANRFIVIRRVCLPDGGPEAFRTYVSGQSAGDIQQTQTQGAARRFSLYAEAMSAVQVALKGERKAANRIGLHMTEALSPKPESDDTVAYVSLRVPVVRSPSRVTAG